MKSENHKETNTREIRLALRQILAATALAGAIGFMVSTVAYAETTARASSTKTSAAMTDKSLAAAPQPEPDNSIRSFQFHACDEALADLKRRITVTTWPSRELAADDAQGVRLATIQKLADYWASQYDWRRAESSDWGQRRFWR